MITQTQIHIVQLSPWPITSSVGTFGSILATVFWFQYNPPFFIAIPLTLLILSITIWWRDVIRESTYQGHHNNIVSTALISGIVLFITTEIIFFSSFFWIFFHVGLIPSHDIGILWPSVGIEYLNPFSVPLLNTGILLVSGVSVTWAHSAIISNSNNGLVIGIFLSVTLGAIFTCLQWQEYLDTSFDITDSATGSALFVATGFHGIHVIIGSIFLIITLGRAINNHFSISHFAGFEMAAWYWHFVDVVWLYLYVCIYWWLGN